MRCSMRCSRPPLAGQPRLPAQRRATGDGGERQPGRDARTVCQSIDSKIGARRRAPRQPADCPGGCAPGRLARKRPARRPLPSASTPAAGSSDTAPTLLLCSTLRHTSVNRHCPDTAPTLCHCPDTAPTLPRHYPDTVSLSRHCPDTAPTLPRHCSTLRHSDTAGLGIGRVWIRTRSCGLRWHACRRPGRRRPPSFNQQGVVRGTRRRL